MTTQEQQQRAREEFYKEKCEKNESGRLVVYENNAKDIANWWIEKFDSLIKDSYQRGRDEARKEMVEKIEKLKHDDMECDCQGYGCIKNFTIEEIINLIK